MTVNNEMGRMRKWSWPILRYVSPYHHGMVIVLGWQMEDATSRNRG